MKNKPDYRSDNVDKIQTNISMTIDSIERADKMISQISDGKAKDDLYKKNTRRNQAIEGLRNEIKDEAKHREGNS